MRQAFLLPIILCLGFTKAFAQGDCVTSGGALYGSPTSNERGKSIVPTPGNDGIYVAGSKDDSTLIMRVNLAGVVIWSRTMDIVPNSEEHICAIMIDSEGMLALSGIGGDQGVGGSVFAFRFNPNSHQILWLYEYLTLVRNYNFSIIEKGPGGNYIMVNNPHDNPNSNDDHQLLELNRNTGTVAPNLSSNYNLGASEGIGDIVFHGNFIYGCGRYTSGTQPQHMRHTIIKVDPSNGTQVWTKMGHVAANAVARLYGSDLIIEGDEIYSVYNGDPAGTSTVNTKLYVQKTSLDGTLLWLRQYELPGNSDLGWEMIKSGSGIVILAAKRQGPPELILYKIDFDGFLLWAKIFQFPSFVNQAYADRGASQLIEVGDKLVFTGVASTTSGGTDLILVRTDLNGEVDMPCVTNQPLSLPVTTINNPSFFTVNPIRYTVNPTHIDDSPDVINSAISPRNECIITDTLYSFIEVSICDGDAFEGYSIEGIYVDNFTTNDGCDSVRTLDLTVNDPIATTENVEICLGTTYAGYSASGTYINTFQNALGCDSIHTLNLTVVPLQIYLSIEICEGEEYGGYTTSGFYVDIIEGPPAECDTLRNLTLTVEPAAQTFINMTICDGEEFEGYAVTGVYTDIFTTEEGCDSVRTLDLFVATEDLTQEEVVICLGESYAGYSVTGTYVNTFQNSSGCDSTHTLVLEVEALEQNLYVEICEGTEYNGYSVSGFYTDTIQGIFNSCDTVRFLELIVNPNVESEIVIAICSGNVYEGYSETGEYIDQFVNMHGCDSLRTLNLTVSESINTELETEICPGESYEGYTDEGIYVDEFISEFGCDSFRTLYLTIGFPEMFLNVSICSGQTFEGYFEEGDYVDVLPGAAGACDTTRYVDLSVLPPVQFNLAQTICSGENYLGYTETGIYIDTLLTGEGCDSIRTLDLFITDQILSTTIAQICPGNIFEGYIDTGVYVDTFVSVAGCDSIRTLNLSVVMPEKTVSATICFGGQFENYSQPGIYHDTIQGISGACDTLRHLTVTVTPPLETFISSGICEGQVFLGYSTSGFYADTFHTIHGCDSVRVLNLIVSDVIIQNESVEICPGSTYVGYSDAGIYLDTFVSAFGCDSVRILELFMGLPTSFVEVSICGGGAFEGYTEAGFYLDTIPGLLNSCDTVRHLTINVTQTLETFISHTVCNGQSFLGYTVTGIFIDTFQTVEGCDSIRILDLTVTYEITKDLIAQICLGESYLGYNQSGIYLDTLQTTAGCDSIVILQLSVVPVEKMLEVEICFGNQFEGYAEQGTYLDTIQGISSLCDTIRHLQLSVISVRDTTIEQSICTGEKFYGYSDTGIYTDTLLSAFGCDSIRTIVLSKIDAVSSHIDANVCEITLFGHFTTGIHIDTLVSYSGCDSIRTIVVSEGSTYIPNVFSPNNDGINDRYTIIPFPENSIDLEYFGVFDRFGGMTYQTVKWPVEWDGRTLDGKEFQSGVFAYVLIYMCGEKRIVEHGDITLLR